MNSDEIRTSFLKFFEEKGHKVIPSSSLIPRRDPTLLLTTAGMVQIKPYFLGEAVPPSRRLASCQKCFRTTDIESVGDATHLTFFEMLGNFSVGDYFKRESIEWAWEFFTRRLKLAPERLWITIFLDDEESFGYWRQIGIPEDRILRFGEEDNFWGPAGNSGPCGPCSEIHYDFGEGKGCGKADCKPNCGCGRFAEIWNLVFTQYNQDEMGKRQPLPRPNIDTGMGLERLVTVMAGKSSVYDTDLFHPLLDCASGLTGRKYGFDDDADKAMRILAEHGRSLAFLLADGVMPSNEGRGYVLRRLLRRAALFGRRLGLDKPFLAEIAETAIERMGHVYPELVQKQEFITKVIQLEETKFEETLSTGLELIEDVVGRARDQARRVISGADAFRLYDTYGFPVELTREVVGRAGFSVDMAGFEREMEKQRERARATHKFEVEVGGGTVGISDELKTSFVGYHRLEHPAKIMKLMLGNSEVARVEGGREAGVVLDTTPFYAEMGGQVGDTGEIRGPSGRFAVSNTIRTSSDVVVHQGVVEGYLSMGDEVEAIVDIERRRDIARNHTATHLLQAALRRVLGEHIQQRGSLVAPERLRFDFSHLAAVTQEELKAVQHLVNEKIRQNLRVYDEETSYQEAVGEGAIALFDEKYGEVVRVMRIGEPAVSTELCGGTHVSFTGELGYFQIISEGSIGAGLRRIEAVTGRGAEAFLNQRLSSLDDIAKSLDTSVVDAQNKVDSLIAELEEERRQRYNLMMQSIDREAEDMVERRAESIKGVNVLAGPVDNVPMQVLRYMGDKLKERLGSGIIVLGTVHDNKPAFVAMVTPDLVGKGYDAGKIVKHVAAFTGGGGGGKADFAQGSGKFKDKLDEALGLVKNLV